jgi:hypothetical protein
MDFRLSIRNFPGSRNCLVGDPRDTDRAASAALDLARIALEHVPRAAAHRSDAQQPDVNWLQFFSV